MSDTKSRIVINSERMGQSYEVYRFTEYELDIDMEMDADQFNVVFANPRGVHTGMFNKFDNVDVFINGVGVVRGVIDDVEYITGESESEIRVVGRDIVAPLVDNDALPGTFYNTNVRNYIANKCSEYGMTKTSIAGDVPNVDKLIIGTGETEISVINNMLVEHFKHTWAIYDTFYMGDWNTGASPSYLFTRGLPPGKAGTPIKKLTLRDSGLDMKSEVRIYGSMDDGSEKVTGTAKNDYLINRGIKKRQVLRSYNDDASSKYASNALRHIRDGFRSGIQVELTIKTGDELVLPNRTAQVIDTITKMNSIFFIKGVKFSKGVDGSLTTVTMIPGDTTFNVLWEHQADKSKGKITGTPSTSLDDLINSRK